MDAIAQHQQLEGQSQDYSHLKFVIFLSSPLDCILISHFILPLLLLLLRSMPMTMQQPFANYPAFHSPQVQVPVINLNTSNESSIVEELPQKKKAPRKQGRNHYTKEQKFALETSFSENMYVSIRERDEIASHLNLTPKQVKVWYQNRRQKDKRRNVKAKMEDKVQPGAESPDSGVQEVDEHHQVAIQHDEPNMAGDSGVVQKMHQYVEKQYEQPIYSYLSNSSANPVQQPQSQYPIEYSQAFANYCNNYDYHFPGAYQYLQFMSGYQSHFSNSAATSGESALSMGMHPIAMSATTTADQCYPGY